MRSATGWTSCNASRISYSRYRTRFPPWLFSPPLRNFPVQKFPAQRWFLGRRLSVRTRVVPRTPRGLALRAQRRALGWPLTRLVRGLRARLRLLRFRRVQGAAATRFRKSGIGVPGAWRIAEPSISMVTSSPRIRPPDSMGVLKLMLKSVRLILR